MKFPTELLLVVFLMLIGPMVFPLILEASSSGSDCEQPELLSAVAPSYPEIARKARVQQEVEVSIDIASNGTVLDAQIPDGTSAVLGLGMKEYIMKAAWQWRFAPPIGEKVCRTVSLNFRFELIDSESPWETPLVHFEPPFGFSIRARLPGLIR